MTRLSRRLAAPDPGWTVETDVVVVGSGIAGLSTALHISRQSALRVLVVTKDVLAAGSTRWAQGGIAAALGAGDSAEEHFRDTIVAGAGVCEEAAVRVLVREGPAAVRELAQIGARFDRAHDGELSLTREGGHHRDRIAHAGGDATGAEIERALVTRVLDATAVSVIEHALVLDLLRTPAGAVAGLTLHVMGEGQLDGVGAVRARAVVLATGGIGQVYASTTNPSVSTGDGVAAALRAGAVVRDLEFVQFHPTVAWLGARSRGQQPLVSEAVRGEGGFLVDDDGHRFMQGRHELADLAPRDVVAKAILRRMRETGAEHMWLDARHFGAEKWRVRFPTIYETLLSLGIDPVRELIPVVPACHYASGGVRTDLHGESSLPGLFVCGESACTGVHGANRLASNSLLEGLVFGARIAQTLMSRLGDSAPPPEELAASVEPGALLHEDVRAELQTLMSRDVGVLRDAKGLTAAAEGLAALAEADGGAPGTEAWETTNLLTVASALVHAATLREETRGAHWRDDFPERDDERWRGHLDTVLSANGALETGFASITGANSDR
ncbi:MAG: L-aspartate oxidase [Pseudonocardiales bacterium]|nr:L-aspartate oxidase [Pseudonocardiales bacterium]